ncbi:hypothetical protein A4W74_06595 [Latilactobacillus curvatus]|uniref:hypothetical protein n=1 Tax=Latilactobacillus curvatus TaxID=28038 RepID=UPI0020A42186|nr:hypothetical protein [Latilactobacillus curvatus]UTB76375.1 hypothetical protein A4W74_06595 [Latilactobacillus curvatus]
MKNNKHKTKKKVSLKEKKDNLEILAMKQEISRLQESISALNTSNSIKKETRTLTQIFDFLSAILPGITIILILSKLNDTSIYAAICSLVVSILKFIFSHVIAYMPNFNEAKKAIIRGFILHMLSGTGLFILFMYKFRNISGANTLFFIFFVFGLPIRPLSSFLFSVEKNVIK